MWRQEYAVIFTDTTPVLQPELWDPHTGKFTLMAPMATPRNYHSIAVLLPDGRVFSGGGGLCGGCSCVPPLHHVACVPTRLSWGCCTPCSASCCCVPARRVELGH